MRDIWFGDKRDLVKWSVLIHLAELHQADVILQLAYYRQNDFGTISIDGEEKNLPQEVQNFFRNIRNIQKLASNTKTKVFSRPFDNRNVYLDKAIAFINKFKNKIVFLDPDTGLEPAGEPNFNHVLNSEACSIFKALQSEDIFVFYQHKTNRNGQEWVESKRNQLAEAIGISSEKVKVAHGLEIANDVAFYFIKKV